MRVLLVEDDSDKLRAVASMLVKIEGLSIDLETVHNTGEAKRRLRENQYDVLILDVFLPASPELAASVSGGIDLLEEINRRSVYKKPREIIGLTAYGEIIESSAGIFSSDLWSLIQFDASSDAWRLQIERKLRYLHLAAQAHDVPAYESELCIVTALPEPELTAVLRLPWGWKLLDLQRDGTQYHEGWYPKDTGTRRVVAACSPHMGMTAAAVLATKMIYSFTPRYLSMVGITAGMRGVCALGDVIAGDPCWDWGSGKYGVKDSKPRFEPAPIQIGLSSYVRGRLGTMARDQAFWDSVRNGWPGEPSDTVLRMLIGPFASGAAVLSDSDVTEGVKLQQRKLLAIDMEAYGILAAANEAPLPQPSGFVLKSVVDFADREKSDARQSYAAYTSVMALKFCGGYPVDEEREGNH